jgi:hypothetical protein
MMWSATSSESIRVLCHRQLLRPLTAVLAMTLTANSITLAAPPDPVKLSNKLTARGIGKSVKITESDGTVVTGKLVAIRNDSFDLMPTAAAQQLTISYTQVVSIHNGPLSTGAKIGIVVGCIVVAVAVTLVIVAKHADIGGLGKGPII